MTLLELARQRRISALEGTGARKPKTQNTMNAIMRHNLNETESNGPAGAAPAVNLMEPMHLYRMECRYPTSVPHLRQRKTARSTTARTTINRSGWRRGSDRIVAHGDNCALQTRLSTAQTANTMAA